MLWDLDGDSKPETLVLIDPNDPAPASNLLRGQKVSGRGFVLLYEVRGKRWPVFYYYNDYVDVFEIAQIEGTRGIVATHEWKEYLEQRRWFWEKRTEDEPVPRWWAQRRRKKLDGSDWGPWQDFPPFYAVCGK